MEAAAESGIPPLASFVHKALWASRYEVVCVAFLLGLWLMGRAAGPKKLPTSGKDTQADCQGRPRQETCGLVAGMPTARRSAKCSSTAAVGTLTCAASSPVQLRNPEFVAEHVARLCGSHFHRAMEAYRSALDADLDLRRLTAADLSSLVVSLATSAIRSGCNDEVLRLFEDLMGADLCVPQSVFSSVVKVCTSKQLFAQALELYDFAAQDPRFCVQDKAIWSCLLFCTLEAGDKRRCPFLFAQLKACGVPTAKDYGNMVRFAASLSDWRLALNLVAEMRVGDVEVDRIVYNSALAICVGAQRLEEAQKLLKTMEQTAGMADAISYNTILKGLTRVGNLNQSFQLFEQMLKTGIPASQVTYGILLDACVNGNALEKAADVFDRMLREGCPMNTVLYTTMIKGLSRAGHVGKAMEVYEKMRCDTAASPDIVTYSVLVKANCDASHLETAVALFEDMAGRGIPADEIVFNSLLGGCAVRADPERGRRLYTDMVGRGLRPSNATFSILIRLYSNCRLLGDAVEMLKTEPPLHNVQVEPRLYLQLIQCCVRERQGRRAVEVYEMFVECCQPTAPMHGRILGVCGKLHMFDTAAQILHLAADRRLRVSACDAEALLEAAVRRHKAASAHGCYRAMQRLGIAADRRLGDQVRAAAEGTGGGPADP